MPNTPSMGQNKLYNQKGQAWGRWRGGTGREVVQYFCVTPKEHQAAAGDRVYHMEVKGSIYRSRVTT